MNVTDARQELIWQVIEDIEGSYMLAMRTAGVDEGKIAEISATVSDYAAHYWGDE